MVSKGMISKGAGACGGLRRPVHCSTGARNHDAIEHVEQMERIELQPATCYPVWYRVATCYILHATQWGVELLHATQCGVE